MMSAAKLGSTADGPSGLVLSQSLKPGARVPRGTALDLTVSQVPLVTVPDVTNLPVSEVRRWRRSTRQGSRAAM